MRLTHKEMAFLLAGCVSALIIFMVGARTHRARLRAMPPEPVYAIDKPVREIRKSFSGNSCIPARREGTVSGSIDMETFAAESDLTEVHDDRIWWESDNDHGDTENDHVMHRSMEEPLMRLTELVVAENGSLEVHDAYRPKGVHAPRSLHKEGRAIDLTCDDLGLERLAILCWASGFDWVFYENKSGAHVHCSVRRVPDRSNWIMPKE